MRHRHGDVEVQAVLAHLRVGVPHLGPGEAGEHHVLDLNAAVGLGHGVADAGPSEKRFCGTARLLMVDRTVGPLRKRRAMCIA